MSDSSDAGHAAQGDPASSRSLGHETAGVAQLSSWATLLMAREAWDIGRPLESWRLMDEAQPDCAYVRKTRTVRVRELPNFRVYNSWGEIYDYDDARDDMAADVREYRHEFYDVNWLAWQPAAKPLTTQSFDAIHAWIDLLSRQPRTSTMYVNPATYKHLRMAYGGGV